MPEPRKVVIVGAGWAGLAAAAELCAHNKSVTLLESARQLGGRARTIYTRDMMVDNGQHLFIGAYRSVLDLMRRIGVDPQHAFLRLPLTLKLLKGTTASLDLRVPGLPAPLHVLSAMLTARGLSTTDRIQALRFGRRLAELRIASHEDMSVGTLLENEAQTPALNRKLWGPLCIAALNTVPEAASARIFLRTLRESFFGSHRHSDLLIPKLALSEVLPNPCRSYLARRGVRIETRQRVTGLELHASGIEAVNIQGRRIDASHVVLAVPHTVSRRLMACHRPLQALCKQLSALGDEPVTTLYLQYPRETYLAPAVLGLEDTLAHWVFDRRVCGQPGLMAVVTSARGPHGRWTKEEFTRRVAAELATRFPNWPPPESSLLIREKRATFSSRVGIDQFRPANRTPVSGLWLAGDYTANGLPATLEGAVRSGTACAQAILSSSR